MAKGNLFDLARRGLEFSYQRRSSVHEEMFKGEPASRVCWTARLGRLAVARNGKVVMFTRGGDSKAERVLLKAQRFATFEAAVAATVKVFGAEPEHAEEMRRIAVQLDE